MNTLLIYMAKAAVTLAVLYFTYHLFLSRDTWYSRNRFFILLSLVSSLVLPLVAIETRNPHDLQVFGRELSGINVTGTTVLASGTPADTFTVNWPQFILFVYIAGMIVAFLRLIVEIMSLFLLISKKENMGKTIIGLVNSRTSGFSAFGHIFIDKSLDPYDAEEIIRHEQKHLDRLHFFDIVLVELLKIIQWFNPFIYMFDRSIRAVHEYQADEECLSSGIPVHSYQGLVMNQVFRTRIFNASNSFSNPTLIKKRMIMMTKKRTRALANLKILLVVPVLVALLIGFSTCSEKLANTDTVVEEVMTPSSAAVSKGTEPEPYVMVEHMPKFPGGDSLLLGYLNKNTVYPESAKANNISGRVVVRFCVTETGTIDRISILKGVSADLDAEAARVVATLPTFEPGMQGGKAVPVWYMVPITFGLKNEKSATTPPPPPPPPPVSETVSGIVQETGGKTSTEPFVVVEEMPKFPGGEEALLAYINSHVTYPVYAKTMNISGQVIIRFIVSESGSVEQISILKGVHPSLDEEAVRVASTLPRFEPGRQKGEAVPVWYMVPITFALK